MKVLIIGQGGREHALAWKLKQSPRIGKLFCAPGNGGTSKIARNIALKADDLTGLKDFCLREKIDLTVVGPEIPLACGIVDHFQESGLRVFGPSKKAAQLEASKVFTKELAISENIPTAFCEIFTDAGEAKDFIKTQKMPIVIKADGLAAGKGVIIAQTFREACETIDEIMVKKVFGLSGEKVIIEEFLEGEEASIIVITDGENIIPLASSQDHKRAFDGDKGPNTGGMGAYSPALVVTDEIFENTLNRIIKPAINGMHKRGINYKGVLYAGIIITENGPKLLEFNVRFGDPETQAILPRSDSDLLYLMQRAIEGDLDGYRLSWDQRSSVCVVLSSGGYPGKYEKNKKISGIDSTESLRDTFVFHAGTKIDDRGDLVTSGGRVLNVVSLGEDINDAIKKVYEACDMIKFEDMHYRRDIGHKALIRSVRGI